MPEIDFVARRPWLDGCLDALVAAGARILVADLDGRPAGFVTVDQSRAMVDQLAVDPARQGRGLASVLLEGAKALCPDGVDLIVNSDNAVARRLYGRHGFTAMADATNPRSGLPTVLMRWTPKMPDIAPSG